MSDPTAIHGEINRYFGVDQLPAVFDRLRANERCLSTLWTQYCSVMSDGEIGANTKELMGLVVAVAESNRYMVAFQRQQARRAGMEDADVLEALAVASFFEGLDAFAHALRVDSDLRPRKLEAGDFSLVDREIDVNVPYVLQPDDPTVCEVYNEIKARMNLPFIPNIFKAMAHQPAILKAKWESYKAIMIGGKLRRLTKELIAIAVSAVNGCFY